MTKYKCESFTTPFYNSKGLFFIFLIGIVIQLTSCQSYKNIPYFQNISSDTGIVYKDGISIPVAEVQDLTIQPNDILNISIQTIDPAVNAVFSPSNAGGSSSNAALNAVANTNAANGNTNTIIGYSVDRNGEIELPVAGKIKVEGLTTAEAREAIKVKAAVFYKDPIVNVQIVNFKVTIIGEVQRPGAYLINGERATLLDAIGQAGDLTIYGMRKNILLSRRENGETKMVRFDLTNTDFYKSPYFYLKQGDVIYIQPTKGKASANDQAMLKYYALITSTLSLLVIVVTRI